MEAELGHRDPRPAHGVEHHVPLEEQLAGVGDVLELAAPAIGEVGAGRIHPVR